MSAKFRNKMKRLFYRPSKKRPHLEFVAKKLDEAEKALGATVGGVFGSRKKKRPKKTEAKKD